MFEAVLLSLTQLGDRAILRVFVKSLIVTGVIFAGASAALWSAADQLGLLIERWSGIGGSGALVNLASLAVLLLGWWLLFRAIAIAVIGLFADEVVAAVERRHYPAAHDTARDLPIHRSAAMGLGTLIRTIGVNLLLAPLYLLLLVTGIGTAALFFLVNAWLLGRDLGDMVAARHLRRSALADWRRQTRIGRFVLGALVTGLLLVPFVNLAAPVLGAALATHWFHRRKS